MADDQRHDIAELYTKMTFGELRRQFSNFDWSIFVRTMFGDVQMIVSNGSMNASVSAADFVDDNVEIVVYGIDFLRRLDVLLPTFPKRYTVFGLIF